MLPPTAGKLLVVLFGIAVIVGGAVGPVGGGIVASVELVVAERVVTGVVLG